MARRLSAEGAEKSWDQCRIKLKNLKSQYRYVKERIPSVASLDLEDDEVMRHLVTECQARGISPSSLKHLRYLRRFLAKINGARSRGGGNGNGPVYGINAGFESMSAEEPKPRLISITADTNGENSFIFNEAVRETEIAFSRF